VRNEEGDIGRRKSEVRGAAGSREVEKMGRWEK